MGPSGFSIAGLLEQSRGARNTVVVPARLATEAGGIYFWAPQKFKNTVSLRRRIFLSDVNFGIEKYCRALAFT
jgi:hypothetical protein